MRKGKGRGMGSAGSTVPRRQLGRYLQQLRGEGQLSVQRVCAELTCSPQKIWRIEAGLTTVKAPDVKALCEVYQATPEVTELLVDLARRARSEAWWQPHGHSTPDWFEPYLVLESSADRLRHYDGEVLHALLQTVPYMTEVIEIGDPGLTEEARQRRITLRRERQRLLDRRGPTMACLEFIVSESVLRRPIADHTAMAAQLRRLVLLNQRRNISIRVLPLAAGPHAASLAGTFALLDFPRMRRREGESPVVYQEGATGGLYLDRPEEISFYERVWQSLDGLALSAGESSDLINSFAGER